MFACIYLGLFHIYCARVDACLYPWHHVVSLRLQRESGRATPNAHLSEGLTMATQNTYCAERSTVQNLFTGLIKNLSVAKRID